MAATIKKTTARVSTQLLRNVSVLLITSFALSLGTGCAKGSTSASATSEHDATLTPSGVSIDLCADMLGPANSVESTNRIAVCQAVNKERAALKLAPLTLDAKLSAIAQSYSALMATQNFFSHTGPDGSTAGSRITAGGITWNRTGENIAQGQATPAAAMSAWMNSTGHRENILSPNFHRIGIGCKDKYWTQDFTN